MTAHLPAPFAAGATLAAPRKVDLLNVFVHDVTMDEVVRGFREGLLLTLHVDMIVKLQQDREFREIFDLFDLVTCDSQYLFAAARLLGTPVRERVSGADFFPRFCAHHRGDPSVTIFLCGGAPGVAEIARRNINAREGREMVVGTCAPPPGFESSPAEVERVISAVNASRASVLVVGLGGGRQEKFIVRHRARFEHARLFLPLGGTIDYEAGTLRRPPPEVTDAGLECLYRLVTEPRKRWRRYLLHQPRVLPLLAAQMLGRYRDPFAPAARRGAPQPGR